MSGQRRTMLAEQVSGTLIWINAVGPGYRQHPVTCGVWPRSRDRRKPRTEEDQMKLSIVLATALLTIGFVAANSRDASAAVVYCQYVDYPAGCVARAGVVLRPRPVARQAVVGAGTVNRGGPVNRAGRR